MVLKKPEKPKKYRTITNGDEFYFDYVSNKVALDVFLDWATNCAPDGAKDVTIGIGEYQYEEDGDGVWIQLEWKEREPNTRYKSEMRSYEKKLKEWKKQCRK